MMYYVHYSDPGEYIEEMKKDAVTSIIEDDIARVTQMTSLSKMGPTLRYVHVVAGYVCGKRIVKLKRFLGEITPAKDGVSDHDKLVMERAQKTVQLIIDSMAELGLEVRSGILSLGEGVFND